MKTTIIIILLISNINLFAQSESDSLVYDNSKFRFHVVMQPAIGIKQVREVDRTIQAARFEAGILLPDNEMFGTAKALFGYQYIVGNVFYWNIVGGVGFLYSKEYKNFLLLGNVIIGIIF
ncbi:MAG: hypothetical protein U9R19_07890 [Bacteroidota bacterium]|nr:hypothetical protein [Bacteroidota bacterium]